MSEEITTYAYLLFAITAFVCTSVVVELIRLYVYIAKHERIKGATGFFKYVIESYTDVANDENSTTIIILSWTGAISLSVSTILCVVTWSYSPFAFFIQLWALSLASSPMFRYQSCEYWSQLHTRGICP